MFGGPGGGGGFLNLGGPEVLVIGAVAWAVLGPKELFKLSREAGKFLGEWQQLGMQAKNTFTSALENELAEDEAVASAEAAAGTTAAATSTQSAKNWFDDVKAEAQQSLDKATSAMEMGNTVDTLPSLSEYSAARAATDGAPSSMTLSAEEEATLRESLYGTLGEPTANAANFEEQMSGARNAAVLSDYPAELSASDAAPADGSEEDVQSADEMLLETQIAAAENDLATLQAEKQVLALKRKQLEANAARARQMAEERLEAAAEQEHAADEQLAEAEARMAEAEAAAEAPLDEEAKKGA